MSDDNITKFPGKPNKDELVVVDTIDYQGLVMDGYRKIVKNALRVMEEVNTFGAYSFTISINVLDDAVDIPDWLRSQHLSTLTIIINQQYENLMVADDYFEVTLYFNGVPAHLHIPYTTLVAFRDNDSDFAIGFGYVEPTKETEQDILPDDDTVDEEHSADVISLDSFRKKD